MVHLATLATLEKYKNAIGHLQHWWLKHACRLLGLTEWLLPRLHRGTWQGGPEPTTCDHCGAPGSVRPRRPQDKLWTCAGCCRVAYCGAACQRAAWPAHREACRACPTQLDVQV
ncbi:unnamed protein product, partial [Heterosigma akashiwo]